MDVKVERRGRLSSLLHMGNPLASPPPPTTSQLPGDWQQHLDDNQSAYYYNKTTGETSWEPPENFREVHVARV